MPLALSTSWDTVPLGLTAVTAVDWLIPSFLAHFLFVATSRTASNTTSQWGELGVLSKALSMIPVMLTPSNASSSVFFFQMLRKYLKSVKVACSVPMIAATSALAFNVSSVSSSRTTISDKLQNWLLRRIISEQGLVPKSWLGSRRPFLAAIFCAATRLNKPRSPDLDSYSVCISLRKASKSGFSVYATLLLASLRCPSFSHHAPDLALAIRPSDRLDRLIKAERLTPPTTTMSATLHTTSWHSMDVSLRPSALRKTSTQKWNKSSNGCAPDARPPNVSSLAPAGRTPDISHLGILPAYSIAISSRNADAHPTLLSPTTIVLSVLWNDSATTGSLVMKLRSTLNPTPVPHISTYISSSKLRGESMAR